MTPAAVHNVVREGYNIEGSCVGDILTACCCGPCAAVRLAAEVQHRGGGAHKPLMQGKPMTY